MSVVAQKDGIDSVLLLKKCDSYQRRVGRLSGGLIGVEVSAHRSGCTCCRVDVGVNHLL